MKGLRQVSAFFARGRSLFDLFRFNSFFRLPLTPPLQALAGVAVKLAADKDPDVARLEGSQAAAQVRAVQRRAEVSPAPHAFSQLFRRAGSAQGA
jgi:hypothetical protein